MVPPLARAIIQKTPHPPRLVPSMRLLAAVLTQRSSRWLQVIALLSLLYALRFAFDSSMGDQRRFLSALALIVVGILVLSVPIIFWWRQGSTSTVDAMKNGFAQGSWRVSTEDGHSFVEAFETDEPFASQIVCGSRIQVLVHPRKPKSIFALALLNGGGADCADALANIGTASKFRPGP